MSFSNIVTIIVCCSIVTVLCVEIRQTIERPIMMYCDNIATVSFSNNLKGISGARYIDIKYFMAKEKLKRVSLLLFTR